MSQYFPKPFSYFGWIANVELGLSNYAKKSDIKKVTDVDTSASTKKIDLASLKSDVGKLDINKLKTVPSRLKLFWLIWKSLVML